MTGIPAIRKARFIRGHRLRFRNADVSDAEFILGLRTDPEFCVHLSAVDPSLDKQVRWLESYARAADQAYFIIETLAGDKVGTLRFYDPIGSSLTWGSWIIDRGHPRSFALESALMAWHYAFYTLDFDGCHFDVRKGNESVWKFHVSFGARRTGETADDYLFVVSKADMEPTLLRYGKYLPDSIEVEFLDPTPDAGGTPAIVHSRFPLSGKATGHREGADA